MKSIMVALVLFTATACIKSKPTSETSEAVSKDLLPLRTEGRFVVDKKGQRFKLKSVNWYGASDSFHVVMGLEKKHRDDISKMIKDMGFNSVRLPFSNEMLNYSEPVPAGLLAANPDLIGKKPLEIFDAIIDSLSKQGLLTILNNHTTTGHWCCSGRDTDALWFNDSFSEKDWVADWVKVIRRYKNNRFVVGADLRNELRFEEATKRDANWGKNDELDWHRAATYAGNSILQHNSDMLIIVEGFSYALALPEAASKPIKLRYDHRLIYSFHSYGWSGTRAAREPFPGARQGFDDSYGYLMRSKQAYTAPIWIGEFGTGPKDNNRLLENGKWWYNFLCYLEATDMDFAYWALNGTKIMDDKRHLGVEAMKTKNKNFDWNSIMEGESYGLLNKDWEPIANDWRKQDIDSFAMPVRQGPGIQNVPTPMNPCQ